MKSTSSKPAGLVRLPLELRLMIITCLVHDGCSMASLAAASRQWQKIIEPYTFSRITLIPSRLSAFNQMARRNQALIRPIWLQIEVQTTSLPTRIRNSQAVGNIVRAEKSTEANRLTAIFQSLLIKLSTWEPDNIDRVLDISIYPSNVVDQRPRPWPNLTLTPDLTTAEYRQFQHSRPLVPSPATTIPVDSSCDLMISWITLYSQHFRGLPAVPAITTVLLRLQNGREWSPTSFMDLLSPFTRLKEFHYQPWRQWSRGEQELIDEGEY